MTISELQKKLEEFKNEYGDIEVLTHKDIINIPKDGYVRKDTIGEYISAPTVPLNRILLVNYANLRPDRPNKILLY